MKAADLMTRNVRTCSQEDSLEQAALRHELMALVEVLVSAPESASVPIRIQFGSIAAPSRPPVRKSGCHQRTRPEGQAEDGPRSRRPRGGDAAACAKAHQKGTKRSTLEELTDWTQWADKALVF